MDILCKHIMNINNKIVDGLRRHVKFINTEERNKNLMDFISFSNLSLLIFAFFSCHVYDKVLQI